MMKTQRGYLIVIAVVVGFLGLYGYDELIHTQPTRVNSSDSHALTVVSSALEPVSKEPSLNKTVARQQTSSLRSQSFSAGQIEMTHQLQQPLTIGVESQLQLYFQLQPHQNLLLSFSDNDRIELMQESESAYTGTNNGIITVLVRFKPVQAGKTYLKFIASTINGENIRAFAIALPVIDSSGSVPKREKITKPRINLPSSTPVI